MAKFLGKNPLVTVTDPLDGSLRHTFPAKTRRIVKRARKMGSKEPGTVQWLHDNLRADDLVLDIGANVGIYTVFAAARLPAGKVYAVEPHAGNFAVLLETVQLNAMEQRIIPLCIALDSASRWIDFSYQDLVQGSSGSQLSSSPTFRQSGSEVVEKKCTHTVDDLIASGSVPAPTVVKIDVDGNELNILGGMRDLLTGNILRTIQIEIDEELEEGIFAYMADLGWTLEHKHFSARGMREMKKHGEKAAYPYNAVFARASD